MSDPIQDAKYKSAILFNCCTDYAEPDWARYDGLEVHPVMECDGACEVCEPADADFYSVYAHLPAGGVECITDCADAAQAASAATALSVLSELPITYTPA